MKKNTRFIFLFSLMITSISCNKKDNANDDASGVTIQNLSGTYSLKALVWVYSGVTINVYDQLDPCEQDNLIRLNPDLSANYIDAGVVCSPPANDNATWDVKNDSLYIGDNRSKVQSFDGKILILTGTPPAEPSVMATTTLEKN